MFRARLAPNSRDIQIEYAGRPIRVDAAEIVYENHRRVLVLKIADFKLLPDSTCPERHRFDRILAVLGDADRIEALKPSCALIAMNSRACDGCPQRPI